MISLFDIQPSAKRVLACNPSSVVRLRLLRDVLVLPSDNPNLILAREEVASNHQVALLPREQHLDGGRGAFHSRDTRRRQKFATTELAVERALALGLENDHPLLQRAGDYR